MFIFMQKSLSWRLRLLLRISVDKIGEYCYYFNDLESKSLEAGQLSAGCWTAGGCARGRIVSGGNELIFDSTNPLNF